MNDLTDREAVVRDICAEYEIDPSLVMSLLALEENHTNLHAYGARPRLRRAAEVILERSFRQDAEHEE